VYGARTPFTQTCRCFYAALAVVAVLLHFGPAMCSTKADVAGGSYCWCSCPGIVFALCKIRRGVMAEECAQLLREFFRWRRSQPGYSDEAATMRESDSEASMTSCTS
jgi:hypothetical protein